MADTRANQRRKPRRLTMGAAIAFMLGFFFLGVVTGGALIPNASLSLARNNLEKAEQKLQSREAELAGLKDRAAIKETENTALNNRVKELEEQNRSLAAQLEEKDTELREITELAAGAPAQDPLPESRSSSWIKWLIISCLALVLIVSAGFMATSYIKNGGEDEPESGGETPLLGLKGEEDGWSKVVSDAGSRLKKRRNEDDERVSEAVLALEMGRLEEEFERLGGFWFGITNLMDVMQHGGGGKIFGPDDSGDYAAFPIGGGSKIKVIPRNRHVEATSVSHRFMGELFEIRNAPQGDFKITMVVRPAEFERKDGAWVFDVRGELLTASAQKTAAENEIE